MPLHFMDSGTSVPTTAAHVNQNLLWIFYDLNWTHYVAALCMSNLVALIENLRLDGWCIIPGAVGKTPCQISKALERATPSSLSTYFMVQHIVQHFYDGICQTVNTVLHKRRTEIWYVGACKNFPPFACICQSAKPEQKWCENAVCILSQITRECTFRLRYVVGSINTEKLFKVFLPSIVLFGASM